MPHISEVANQYIERESSIIALMQNAMTVADPTKIEKWIIEVMVCTTKQSALTEKDMALKARVYAGSCHIYLQTYLSMLVIRYV